jgi:hypothetical protein
MALVPAAGRSFHETSMEKKSTPAAIWVNHPTVPVL